MQQPTGAHCMLTTDLGFALHRWQNDVCGTRVEDHSEVLGDRLYRVGLPLD